MVGTGVFTALGFQAVALHTGAALLSLWVVGGVVALCGALAYAELGAMYPHSGGEFVYLGRAWHALLGFLGGWVSMTVGFAAPIALAGIAFGRYLSAIVPVTPLSASLLVVALIVGIHLAGLHAAKRFQVLITGTQLALVTSFIVAGLTFASPVPIDMGWDEVGRGGAWGEILSAPYAVSLVYVSFAFTGWNAAGYIAGEIETPHRTIPRAVVASTLLVTVLYVLLNLSFLRTVPLEVVAGKVEVGALSATAMFGARGGQVMSAIIAAVLIATISSMVLGGSRGDARRGRVVAAVARARRARRRWRAAQRHSCPGHADPGVAAHQLIRAGDALRGLHAQPHVAAHGARHDAPATHRAGGRATVPRLGLSGDPAGVRRPQPVDAGHAAQRAAAGVAGRARYGAGGGRHLAGCGGQAVSSHEAPAVS